MSVTIRNTGAMEGNENTNQRKSFGEVGVSRFVYQGAEYCCGVNATVTIPDLIGDAWVASDSRVKLINRS